MRCYSAISAANACSIRITGHSAREIVGNIAHGTSWSPQIFPAGVFFGAQIAANPPAFAANNSQAVIEVAMPRRQNSSYQPTAQYNAYLAGWVFAFSVVLVTFMLIAHGAHF